jgi:hypothetical protein
MTILLQLLVVEEGSEQAALPLSSSRTHSRTATFMQGSHSCLLAFVSLECLCNVLLANSRAKRKTNKTGCETHKI